MGGVPRCSASTEHYIRLVDCHAAVFAVIIIIMMMMMIMLNNASYNGNNNN